MEAPTLPPKGQGRGQEGGTHQRRALNMRELLGELAPERVHECLGFGVHA